MSTLAENVTRIANAKTAIKNAINAKGGSLTTELIGSYAAAVAALPSGGGSFYKCASVSGSSWTGYKAVQDSTSKAWSFESTLTSDTLTVAADAPTVGNVYNADATAAVTLYNGQLIVYAPLHSYTTTAETGQTITYGNSYNFTTINGVQCVELDGSGNYLSIPVDTTLSGTFTWSFLVYAASDKNCAYAWFANEYSSAGYDEVNFGLDSENGGRIFTGNGSSDFCSSSASIGTWYHIAIVYNNDSSVTLYRNGVQVATGTNSSTTISGSDKKITFNAVLRAVSALDDHGYYAETKVWKRALSAAEILAEYNRVHTWS